VNSHKLDFVTATVRSM